MKFELCATDASSAARYRFFSYGDAMLVWPLAKAADPAPRSPA